MPGAIDFQWLSGVDFIVEQAYQGGNRGSVADDPLSVLLPVGNQGGFRYKGSPARGDVRLVVLYTSGRDIDWPDELDVTTGTFTYYGDNRVPGRELHDTQRKGNVILRDAFANAAGGRDQRALVPPFLLFEKVRADGRDVRFRGLMVPGSPLVLADEQLVAIWRNRQGQRFQNYRAIFTVLDEAGLSRAWIDHVLAGRPGVAAPRAWIRWVDGGAYDALVAPPTTNTDHVRSNFRPTATEWDYSTRCGATFVMIQCGSSGCVVELFRFSVPGLENVEVTRPTRDGGRDAVVTQAVGPAADPVRLEFALEAKCYQPEIRCAYGKCRG